MNACKRVWGSVIVISCVAVAYFLGVQVANLYTSHERMKVRTRTTASVLEKMHTIQVGDKLPDNVFESLDGDDVTLSSMITGRSLITFFAPDCYLCIEHLDNARCAVSDASDYQRVLLISSADRVDLREAVSSYGIRFPLLWDRDRSYSRSLNVIVEPLVIEVDENMVIRQIVAGALTTGEISRIYEEH